MTRKVLKFQLRPDPLARRCDVAKFTARRTFPDMSQRSLPGADLIDAGLNDLARGQHSIAALLVSIGAPRLRRLGIDVPAPVPAPEHRLYEMLHAENAATAHSRYNALIRRLVSFERAAECAS